MKILTPVLQINLSFNKTKKGRLTMSIPSSNDVKKHIPTQQLNELSFLNVYKLQTVMHIFVNGHARPNINCITSNKDCPILNTFVFPQKKSK